MGLLDGVFGGVVGAVTDVIRRNGGVQGVVNQFETQGFGPTVRSWVSTGPNQTIDQSTSSKARLRSAPADVGQDGDVRRRAQTKLAEILPQAIDQMTPAA
jgi:uncharacterized protein YidB (DUF937 family)